MNEAQERSWQRSLILIRRIHQIATGAERPPAEGPMPINQAGSLSAAYSDSERIALIIEAIAEYRGHDERETN